MKTSLHKRIFVSGLLCLSVLAINGRIIAQLPGAFFPTEYSPPPLDQGAQDYFRDVLIPESPVICIARIGEQKRVLDEAPYEAPFSQGGVGFGVGFGWRVVEILPEYVLKGDLSGATEMRLIGMPPGGGGSSGGLRHVVNQGDRLLLFLQLPTGEDSSYILPARKVCKVRLFDGGTPLTDEQLSSVESAICAEYAVALRSEDNKLIHEVMSTLGPYITNREVISELTSLSHSSELTLSTHALNVLAQSNDVPALKRLLERIESGVYVGFGGSTSEIHPSWGIYGFGGDPAALDDLVRFAGLPQLNARFRTVAINAIARLESDRKFGPLMDLLGTGDATVQFQIVKLLIVLNQRNPRVPEDLRRNLNNDRFIEDRDRIVQGWNTWWNDHGRTKYETTSSNNE